MSDYTPTTEEMRKAYARYPGDWIRANREARKQFDRWLAEVKAQAWEEGNKQAHQDIDGEWPTSYTSNPYREGEK
jgi:hypothetical protein